LDPFHNVRVGVGTIAASTFLAREALCMEGRSKTMLRVGAWCVNPATGEISRNGEALRLEARAMLLLLCLAEHPGEVVSIEELLNQVWSGVIVSPDSVYQAVASLRRQLGDDPKQPSYIATVPRLGYRMVATVGPWTETGRPDVGTDDVKSPTSRARNARQIGHSGWSKGRVAWAVVAVLFFALVVGVALRFRAANSRQSGSPVIAAQPQKSVAVLPFLDLTDGMTEEEFADGMTEELIDKLSKVPDFRVTAPTSSFYFKGKKVPLAEIAKTLGVAFVLDGSVRKSAARFRVAARLVRAENGYVIWSETYDRPLVDKLLVQEDIAGEVAKALRASIEGSPEAR
jgi:TolB-like protein/DNA-binding winged helix-turn-helix (wHTH) protein